MIFYKNKRYSKMKTRFFRYLGLVLALTFACNALSCKRLPKTIVSETYTYYSYSNVNYGDHERHYLDLFIPKGESVSQGMNSYTFVSILNRICRIGIMSANENILNIADKMFYTSAHMREFL